MTVKIRPARGKSGRWECDIRFTWPEGGGFRERVNAPVTSKSAALRWGQARETALLAAGRASYLASKAAPVESTKALTFAEFWPDVLRDHYRANRKKASTIDAAESIVKNHLAHLASTPLERIDAAEVAAIKGRLAEKGPKTVNNVLSVLSRILRCAVEWGRLERLPKIPLLPTARKEITWYEREDYRRAIAAAAKLGSSRLVLALLAGSAGLRRGEIISLEWTDVDLARRQLKVSRATWRTIESTPKGGRGRIVPLTDELVTALRAHRHLIGPRVLYTDQGRVLSNRSVRNWMASIQRRAGLEANGGIHILRHTFCSHLAAAGVPAKAIQELAGHADLSTTLRYMHLAPSDRNVAMTTLETYYGGETAKKGARAR